jgi:hypothetical protein
MYLLKGREAFDHSNRTSQSHGHALADAVVSVIELSKYYPWYQIRPISQEFMTIKVDPNYPDWFVHSDDCLPGVPGVPPVPPVPTTGITDEQAAQALVTIIKFMKQ